LVELDDHIRLFLGPRNVHACDIHSLFRDHSANLLDTPGDVFCDHDKGMELRLEVHRESLDLLNLDPPTSQGRANDFDRATVQLGQPARER